MMSETTYTPPCLYWPDLTLGVVGFNLWNCPTAASLPLPEFTDTPDGTDTALRGSAFPDPE